MNAIVLLALGLAGAALAFCTAYQLLWMLLSVPSWWRRTGPRSETPTTKFAVLVPAHNEALLIEETVRSFSASRYPDGLCTIYVIADNCSDKTADIAAAAGARVLERRDDNLRGKPYALAWALDRIEPGSFDAVLIIDGDTAVDPDFLAAMAVHVKAGAHAVQGYFGVLNPNENWLTRLGVIPAAIKFRLHFPGKIAAGLSCPLAGNGMCFSREVIERFGWNAFSLTENWEYYIMLTLRGYLVTAAPEAVIYSQVARSLKLGEPQRMRWMKGRMETLRRYWWPLVSQGLTRPGLRELDALVELARPSYSMLFIWSVAYLALCAVASATGTVGVAWPIGAGILVVAQAAYVVAGVVAARQGMATWLALAAVPFYLGWKLVVSLKGVLTIRDKTWVKTTRH